MTIKNANLNGIWRVREVYDAGHGLKDEAMSRGHGRKREAANDWTARRHGLNALVGNASGLIHRSGLVTVTGSGVFVTVTAEDLG